MRKQVVLAIDDEIETLDLLKEALGTEYEILTIQNSRKGLASALLSPPDLLLLDIDMPHLNGFQVCEKFRAGMPHLPTPVIFLSSDMEASSMQRALKAGANDYLIKPFRISDLLSRIAFRLKQVEMASTLCSGNLKLDPSSLSVQIGHHSIRLTRGSFRILQTLIRSSGRIVSREELRENELRGGGRSVDLHVLRLRKLLVEWDHSIEAIYGHGYIVTKRFASLKNSKPRTTTRAKENS